MYLVTWNSMSKIFKRMHLIVHDLLNDNWLYLADRHSILRKISNILITVQILRQDSHLSTWRTQISSKNNFKSSHVERNNSILTLCLIYIDQSPASTVFNSLLNLYLSNLKMNFHGIQKELGMKKNLSRKWIWYVL